MASIVRSSWISATVLKNYQWTSRLYSLHLEADLMPFKAGQFVRLQLPLTDNGEKKLVAKSYSLINAPDDPVVEIL